MFLTKCDACMNEQMEKYKKKIPNDQMNMLKKGSLICSFRVWVFNSEHGMWYQLVMLPNFHRNKEFISQKIK